MTREEAIKQFETLLLHVDTDCVMGMETTEAINMAIKALKQPEPCEDDPRADVYYLAEKIGIHQLYALVVQLRGEPEPCEDAVSREEVLNCLEWQYPDKLPRTKIMELPPVTPKQPEYHEIGYRECADAVLKMWMDNVLTDGEHNRIIDKLHAKWAIAEGDAE